MKVTVDLPDWIVAALLRAYVPEELAGATIEERLYFIADDWAVTIMSHEAQLKRQRLYEAMGVPFPEDDESMGDDPPPF